MKEIEVKKYVAFDGTEFNDKDDCEDYELTTSRDADTMLNGIQFVCYSADDVFPTGDYTYAHMFIYLENLEQATRFKRWFETYDCGELADAELLVGETLVVDYYTMGDGCSPSCADSIHDCISIEEKILSVTLKLMKFAKEARNKSVGK